MTVTAADNIGNTGDTGCTFTMLADIGQPAQQPQAGPSRRRRAQHRRVQGPHSKLNQAVKKHDAGQHPVEWNALDAFSDQIEGQIEGGPSGSGIDPVVGRRFIAYAQDVINRGA